MTKRTSRDAGPYNSVNYFRKISKTPERDGAREKLEVEKMKILSKVIEFPGSLYQPTFPKKLPLHTL